MTNTKSNADVPSVSSRQYFDLNPRPWNRKAAHGCGAKLPLALVLAKTFGWEQDDFVGQSVSFRLGGRRSQLMVKRNYTLMKNGTIIGIGVTGLLCSIVGGYYYWVIMRIAMLFAYAQSDGSLNRQAWLWLAICCIGVALLLTSGIAFFICRRRKNTQSAA